jgi:hypothetical protein
MLATSFDPVTEVPEVEVDPALSRTVCVKGRHQAQLQAQQNGDGVNQLEAHGVIRLSHIPLENS